MKFGKELRNQIENTLPEWRDKYLRYKALKMLLKHISATSRGGVVDSVEVVPATPTFSDVEQQFIQILWEELEKFNDLYFEKEELFVILFTDLMERIERVKKKSSQSGPSEVEIIIEKMEIRDDFIKTYGEMMLLKNYCSFNFLGLMKILKKYDKRTGGLLRICFTQVARSQPFFTAEPLTTLVRVCEANLETLL